MMIRTPFTNTLRTLLFTAAVAVVAMGCDGADVGTPTSTTQPLTAALDRHYAAETFELTVRISEPSDGALREFEHLERYDAEPVVQAGLDLYPSYQGRADLTDIRQTFAATVAAVTNNEYVGEQEVRDAVNQPFFTSVPLTACGGVFPCGLTLRIAVERLDFTVASALHIEGDAWVHSDHFDVAIVDVVSFPTY